MKQGITIRLIQDLTDPLLGKIEETYIDSFPEVERRDFSLVKGLMQTEPLFRVYVLLSGDVYAGFITAWFFDSFIYIEHFAVDASARNGGIGGEAFRQFLVMNDKPVILEVEMPDDDMSRRRIGFYERLGFSLNHQSYQQPPYRSHEGWLDMLLMSYGDIDVNRDFSRIKDNIYRHVSGLTCQ